MDKGNKLMQISQYAPVFITTLCRDVHFKRCIESLSKCTHADKTDLIIALDYPLNDSHWKGYEIIKKYLKTISGFKNIIIFEREKNLGARENRLVGMKWINRKYDRYILSEDDNEFSPNFLDYINKGLDKFEDDENVLTVCGYCFPIEIPESYKFNYYYYQRFAAWGYGTWVNKTPTSFVWDYHKLTEFMGNKKYVKKLKKQAERHYYKVKDCIKNKMTITGDGVGLLINIMQNTYCVYPTLSKVRNHGHDGTGIHCGTILNNPYAKQKIDTDSYYEYQDTAPLVDKSLDKIYRQMLKISKRQYFISIINRTNIGCIVLSFFKRRKNERF